jgi:hypothetical protein
MAKEVGHPPSSDDRGGILWRGPAAHRVDSEAQRSGRPVSAWLFELAVAHAEAQRAGTGAEADHFETLYLHFEEGITAEGGRLRSATFGRHVPCAVVEVEWSSKELPHRRKGRCRRSILVTAPAVGGDSTLRHTMRQFERVYVLADRFTEPDDADVCHHLARSGLEDCVAALDSDGARPSERQTADLQRQLESVDGYYRRAAERRAYSQYIRGMLLGVVLVPPLCLLFMEAHSWLLQTATQDGVRGSLDALSQRAPLGLIGGGIGAVISVLIRVNSGRTTVNAESSRQWRTFSPALQRGVLRVVLGCLFGVTLTWFLSAGLLPLPGTAGDRTAAYGALSFLAGFSERWARDAVLGSVSGHDRRPASPADPAS